MTYYKTYTLDEALLQPKEEIISIDLASENIDKIPLELFKFKNLENLSLKNNNIKEIPLQLFELCHLKELNLSDNQITKIPEAIKSLNNLEELYLDVNPLENIPKLPLSLRVLSLNQTCQKEIHPNIYELKNLEKLNLVNYSDNPKEHLFNTINNIPSDIKKLKKLETLDLSFNKNLNQNINVIFQYLSELKQLDTLMLNGIGMTSFPPVLLDNLSILYLDENNLSKFPTELFKMPKLNMLSLTLNALPFPEIKKTLLLEQDLSLLAIWGNNTYNDPRFSERETDIYGDPCLTEEEIEMMDLEYEDFVNTLEQKFDDFVVEAHD